MISLNYYILYIYMHREREREIHHGNWLPGWWLNQPIWKIVEMGIFPNFWGENEKYVSCHHLATVRNIPSLQYSPTDRPHHPSHLLQRLGVIPLRPSYLPFGWWIWSSRWVHLPPILGGEDLNKYLSCHHPDMQMMFKAPMSMMKDNV